MAMMHEDVTGIVTDRRSCFVEKIRDHHHVFERLHLKVAISDHILITGRPRRRGDHGITMRKFASITDGFVLEASGFECELLVKLERLNAAELLPFLDRIEVR